MLRKPKYAWCNDRTRLAEENPTAGNPQDWLTRRSLEGTGLQSISFDFLVNWNKNSLVDEVWIKRIVDDVCTPWPIMDRTTLEDWIRQVDSCEDLNILIHFCRINDLSCHHFLFKDLPQWTDDMNEIVEIELMQRPPTVRVINPRQIQQRLRSLRGGPAKMGGKGLRIGPSTLECYLSWKEDIWPGDVDAILVDGGGKARVIIEYKKHTNKDPVPWEKQTLKEYRQRDPRKYQSLGILRDRLGSEKMPQILLIFYPTDPSIREIIVERLGGPFVNMETKERTILPIPRANSLNSQKAFARAIVEMI
jgi:hypothetical protein